MLKPTPARSVPVSSPGMRPRLQTDVASAIVVPAPCTKTQASVQAAMRSIVT